MQDSKYNLLFVDIKHISHLSLVYKFFEYEKVYNCIKDELILLDLELLGIFTNDNAENLMYYENDYYEDKIKDEYLMSFDEIIESIKQHKNCLMINNKVFASKNKFNLTKTYKFDTFIKKLVNMLNEVDNKICLCDYTIDIDYFNYCCPYINLLDIKAKNNVVFMMYLLD